MTNNNANSGPMIRAAAILIEDERICLVKQRVTEKRNWSLPGGRLELGETLEECIRREFKEETGLDVRVRELLYVTDRIIKDTPIYLVHISFLVGRIGNGTLPLEWKHIDPSPSRSLDSTREVRMVPVNELNEYGFSTNFCKIVKENFPGRGSYKGNFSLFYGE